MPGVAVRARCLGRRTIKATPIDNMAVDSVATRPVVLLVDDEPMIHVIASRTLERAGWRVLNACDGVQAIELLGFLAEAPSLVISDMRMPRMSGAELGQWLESHYPAVPILYISGFIDAAPAAAYGARRASLGKPFTPAMLLQTVQELCNGSVAQTQQ
jgi:two-component system, cell cycle sensor histidine kinase and response regulator CckA